MNNVTGGETTLEVKYNTILVSFCLSLVDQSSGLPLTQRAVKLNKYKTEAILNTHWDLNNKEYVRPLS